MKLAINYRQHYLKLNDWSHFARQRPKLWKGLRSFVRHTVRHGAADSIDKVLHTLIWAPHPRVMGCTLPPGYGGPPIAIIYFSPLLEHQSQNHNDYIVAHEFAHHILGHNTNESVAQNPPVDAFTEGYEAYSSSFRETEADALIASWGYKIPRCYRLNGKNR